MKALIPLLLVSAALFGPINPRDIIRRSVAAIRADWEATPNYSYIERDVNRELDSGGNVKSVDIETNVVTMIEGSPYYRLIARDDKPLSQAEQQEEARELQQEIENRRNESPEDRAKRIAEYEKERKQDFLMISQMADAFDFRLLRETDLDGRDVYEFEATPRPGYQPPNTKAKALTGMQGRLWVDKKTFQWVKVEAEVVQPVSFYGFLGRLERGTQIEFEQMPVGKGVWQPKRLRVKVDAKILFLFGKRSDDEEFYSHYHRIDAAQQTSAASDP